MTEAPDRGTGSEPFRKTDHRQGTQCGQSTLGSFRMAPIPYSHYQRLLSGGRAQEKLGMLSVLHEVERQAAQLKGEF